MTQPLNRRSVLALLGMGVGLVATGCGSASTPSRSTQATESTALTVFKDPSCGCCGGWIKHAEAHGFAVTINHPDSLTGVFEEHRIPADLQSCHLSLTGDRAAGAGAVFVGHVPAKFVLAYLADPPPGSRGLSVPAMPVGTPGMEMGDTFDPYDVLLLREDGGSEVFASVASADEQV